MVSQKKIECLLGGQKPQTSAQSCTQNIGPLWISNLPLVPPTHTSFLYPMFSPLLGDLYHSLLRSLVERYHFSTLFKSGCD